ncbi:MAG: tRNA-splicing ligase RtcB, partial [bacterium]
MNYQVFQEKPGFPVKAWVNGVPFEEQAKEQVLNVAKLPFIHKWVAIMPDVHLGKGATVGSVIPTIDAIIPAAVGVDIGCGMMAVKTSLNASQLPDNLYALRIAIEKAVPHGRTNNGGRGDRGAWGSIPTSTAKAWDTLDADFNKITEKHPRIKKSNNIGHLGTLGTGNHFIEVCLDEHDQVWVMLHSGSRGVGNNIGTHFIQLAKKEMQRWFLNVPDKDLAYLPEGSEYFDDYVEAVDWAQRFAMTNRQMVMSAVLS